MVSFLCEILYFAEAEVRARRTDRRRGHSGGAFDFGSDLPVAWIRGGLLPGTLCLEPVAPSGSRIW
jgi:hypothetical protein